jgi:hypothetical protein
MNIFDLLLNKKQNTALQEMAVSFEAQHEVLQNESLDVKAKLQELIIENQKNGELVAQTITGAIRRLDSIKTDFAHTAQLMKESSDNILQLKLGSKLNVGATNNLTGELGALRKTILDAMQGGGNTVVERLNSISSALENNINKTFSTIDGTLKENAEKLFESYDRFFELCKTLRSDDDEEEDAK